MTPPTQTSSTRPAPEPSPTAPSSAAAGKVEYHGTPLSLHYAALAGAILGPLGMLLPPRRGLITPQNMALAAAGYLGLNQLAHDYTGKSIVQRTNERVARMTSDKLPERAERNRQLMADEKARRQRGEIPPPSSIATPANVPEQKKTAPWKEERLAREKEAFAQGKGISDLIMEQIWEVWNQGQTNKPAKPDEPRPGNENGQESKKA